ncbi:MAG: leucyl aminopeptidase [Gemmatimonadales bacterium]
MKSAVQSVPLERVSTPLLGIGIAALSGRRVPRSLRGLDAKVGRGLSRLISSGDFVGERDQVTVLYPNRGPKRVMLVGLGPLTEVTRGSVRRSAAVVARKAVAAGVTEMTYAVVPEARGGVSSSDLAQVVAEGAWQGAWQFGDFKADRNEHPALEHLRILVGVEERKEAAEGLAVGAAVAAGQSLARDLQAQPGNVCTPEYLANKALKLSKAHGHKATVLDRAQIEKAGMGALLAVAQGSEQDPRFIALEYKGAGRAAPVCFVGKGVTFDSGGISIKPALHMEEMKYDMSGAAAVLGLFETLGRIEPKINVVGLIPSTENLPSGVAVKPGDIVRAHAGKSIEVVNTDAEGRLILCDALSYARRYKPTCVIDAATLTGAIVVGLGAHATGLMGNDDSLIEELVRAGELADERCWVLPLWDEYREQLKSDVADIKNTGGRAAGSITAGWFLREFVDGFPWAHLDIAGTAYTDTDRPDMAKGPTGLGVRLFSEFVLGRSVE